MITEYAPVHEEGQHLLHKVCFGCKGEIGVQADLYTVGERTYYFHGDWCATHGLVQLVNELREYVSMMQDALDAGLTAEKSRERF